jgi:hypothetical protein
MVNVNAPLPFNLNNNTAHRPNHHHAQQPPQQQQQTRLDSFRARGGSPQPSLDMERQSVLSSASASQEIFEETTRRPVLNVRIVRPGSALARGRPIARGAVPSSELQQQEEGPEPKAGAEGAAAGGNGGEQDATVCLCFISSLRRFFAELWFFCAIGCDCQRQCSGGRTDTFNGIYDPERWVALAELG